MKDVKTFYVVNDMIFEQEQNIQTQYEFIKQNKGNQKMKLEVSLSKTSIQTSKEILQKLYRIQNSLYGV